MMDDRLALDHVIARLETARIPWGLHHNPRLQTPEFRYELRIFEGPARAIYRGSTATMAATAARDALDAALETRREAAT